MPAQRPSAADKRRSFRRLHQSGCFVIPNPWDIGSARFLQTLGFQALATTSAGFAWSQGYPDGAVSRSMMLAHLQTMADATELPLNADFQSGFASDPAAVAGSVRAAVATGIAGLSIEDSTGDASEPLFPISAAVERMRAARGAMDESDPNTLLVGRAEGFLVGRPDLADTITRLKAYADAGADCLYAPGLRTREQIAAVVSALAPKPVNVLWSSAGALTVAELAALGVRRISIGGALARIAWESFARAAREIAEQGRFSAFTETAATLQLNQLFGEDRLRREGARAR